MELPFVGRSLAPNLLMRPAIFQRALPAGSLIQHDGPTGRHPQWVVNPVVLTVGQVLSLLSARSMQLHWRVNSFRKSAGDE